VPNEAIVLPTEIALVGIETNPGPMIYYGTFNKASVHALTSSSLFVTRDPTTGKKTLASLEVDSSDSEEIP